MKIDLQVHSTYSDGFFSPTKLANFLAKNEVKLAALTDHNTVKGQDEFKRAAKKVNIKTITGLELYVYLEHRRVNILWYNFDDKDPELHDLLRETQIRRKGIVRKALNKLKEQGYKVQTEKILDKFTNYVAVNKVASEFYSHNKTKVHKELNNINPLEEDILHEYFYSSDHARLRETYINIERVFKLRKKIGGQIIFCHPGKHNKYRGNLPEKLNKLGIDGIEVLSPHHTIGAIVYCQYLAQKYSWIETGGSDFHLPTGQHFSLQHSWQWFHIESNYLREIYKIIK
ncbi:PHP domain-containing protein [Patescibacteria group bacterium]|nr:PHP domain-containing protein [Patescibacteria group bacterium]